MLVTKWKKSIWNGYVLYDSNYMTFFPRQNFGDSKRISESEVAQSCPTLCDPVDCSLPGSSVHGFFQARVLEWGAVSFSRGSSHPRDWTQVSCIAGRCFNLWATREVNKIEVDVFLELSCFLNDPMDVGNFISGSSAFSKSSFNIWKFLNIWKTVFIPIPKKGNAKNVQTTAQLHSSHILAK